MAPTPTPTPKLLPHLLLLKPLVSFRVIVTLGDAHARRRYTEGESQDMTLQEDITDIAGIIRRRRPDWGLGQIRDALSGLKSAMPALTAGGALDIALRAAADSKAQVPQCIMWERYRQPAVVNPMGPRCLDHPTEAAHACGPCISEVKVGDRPARMVGKRLLGVSTPLPGTRARTWRELVSEAASRAAQGATNRNDTEP